MVKQKHLNITLHVHLFLLNFKRRQRFFYSPIDVQENCLKNNFKTDIKIYIKTAPTCFGAVTPSSWGGHYACLLKLQLLK